MKRRRAWSQLGVPGGGCSEGVALGFPAELPDSLVFRHRRGTFAGAVQGTPGPVEQADGGTFFLDEVGDLPAIAPGTTGTRSMTRRPMNPVAQTGSATDRRKTRPAPRSSVGFVASAGVAPRGGPDTVSLRQNAVPREKVVALGPRHRDLRPGEGGQSVSRAVSPPRPPLSPSP
jgi:hypothetical protein